MSVAITEKHFCDSEKSCSPGGFAVCMFLSEIT